MEFFDSHCHFDFEAFDAIHNEECDCCVSRGVRSILVPGVSPWEHAQLPQALANRTSASKTNDCQRDIQNGSLPKIYYALGLHPWWIDAALEANCIKCHDDNLWDVSSIGNVIVERINESVKLNAVDSMNKTQCVAIGECGLDRNINVPMALQQQVFESQLKLAAELELPIIVHSVKAHNDVLRALKPFSLKGVVHGFSGSFEEASQYWSKGILIGVGGTITYERARKTRDAVARMPIESILFETDAPDMPICDRQGQLNRPSYLPDIAACAAELRGVSLDVLAEQVLINTKRLFKIDAT